jgi:PAS domain S-box-containing protein
MKSHFTSEKKLTDKQSRQAELLNDIQNALLAGSWEWEPETDHYFWTDSMFYLHGLTPSSDNLISIEAAHQMIHPDDFLLMQSYWEELHRTGHSDSRFRIITSEGKIKEVHAQGKAAPGREDSHLFRGSFQEQKSELQQYLLDEIQKKQIRIDTLERAEEISQSGTWKINLHTYETFYSDNMFRLHGIPPGGISSHPDSFMRFVHPDDKEIVRNSFEKSYQERIPLHIEYRIIRQDDEERFIKLVSSIIKNEKGEQLLTGTTHDITEKKWLELELEQSYDNLKLQHQLFQQAEQLGATGAWQLNLQTLEVYYSDNIYTIHGLKPQSMVPAPDSFFPYIHPDDREMMAEAHAKIMDGQTVPLIEYRIIRADGKSRTLRQITKHSATASNQKLLMGVIQDITEQHSIRTQLKEINEKLLVQNESFIQAEKIVSIGNWFWNLNTGHTNYSENTHNIYDVKPESLPKKIEDFVKFIHPEDKEVFKDIIKRIKAEETVVDSEYRIILSGGQTRYLRNRNKLILSPDEEKIVIGTIQDISHETILQQQLSERMDFAEMLSDTIHDTIIVTDTANNIMACNKQCEKIHGFKKSDVFGKNIFHVFPQLKTSEMIENIRKAYQGKPIQIHAVKSVLTKGYHDLLIRPLKNKKDQMIGVLMLLHDVTQEYQLQQQLKERIAFIEKLVESSIDRIMVLDNNLNYIVWNKNCEQYYGIKKEDIIGKNVLELFPMFKADPVYQDCKKALKGESIHIPVKENDTHNYSESFLIPIKDEKGQVGGILWIMHDLTDIMKAREQLVISEAHLKTAQKIAHLGSWEYHHNTGTLLWSDEVFRMYGYEPGSFEPTTDFYISTSHPDHRTDIQELLLLTRETYSFTNRIYTLDGRLRHIQTIGHIVSNGLDKNFRVIGTMQDITEQITLQDQLREKTKAIRNQYELVQQAELVRNVSTWQWNTESNKVFWSENLFRIFGYVPYSFEPTFELFKSMVHPEDEQIVLNALEVMHNMETGSLPLIEYRVLDKEGKVKYLRTGGRVVKNKIGKYVTGTVNDITEYVLMRQQLLRSEQLLETIIDLDSDAISIYDNNLRCMMWNKHSEKIYGKSKSEAIDKYLFNLIPQLNQESTNTIIQQIIKDDLIVDADQHVVETDNIIIEISPVSNVSNEETGLLIITKQKHPTG